MYLYMRRKESFSRLEVTLDSVKVALLTRVPEGRSLT